MSLTKWLRETLQRSVGSLNFNANVERPLSPSLTLFHTSKCDSFLSFYHALSILNLSELRRPTFLFSSPVSVETSCFEGNPLHALFLIMEDPVAPTTKGRLISVWKAKTKERSRTSWTRSFHTGDSDECFFCCLNAVVLERTKRVISITVFNASLAFFFFALSLILSQFGRFLQQHC